MEKKINCRSLCSCFKHRRGAAAKGIRPVGLPRPAVPHTSRNVQYHLLAAAAVRRGPSPRSPTRFPLPRDMQGTLVPPRNRCSTEACRLHRLTGAARACGRSWSSCTGAAAPRGTAPRWCRRLCLTWRPPAAATSCSRSYPSASASAKPWSPSSTATSISSSSLPGLSGAHLSCCVEFNSYLLGSASLAPASNWCFPRFC